MAKVSILMNAYNSQKYLKETIDSIYAQTFKDWKIIFIDNCSTDNTKKIVDSYDDKIEYYRTNENIPLGAARNFGLQYCRGEYIAFLDTDDVWLIDKLEVQIKLMNDNKGYQLCYGGVIYIDKNSKQIGKMIPLANTGNVFAQQLKKYEINMQSVLLRNTYDIEINEKLRHSPDYNLFMSIVKTSEVYVIKDYLVKYRKLEDSLTFRNIDVWWSEMKYTLDRIFASDEKLKERYPTEYKLAYAKVAYYKARYYLSIGEKRKVTRALSKYKYSSITYFIIYILSFMPTNIINKIIKQKV